MKRIILVGPTIFTKKETMEAYEIAEAAIRAMWPKAFIFNPCKYFDIDRMKNAEAYMDKRKKLRQLLNDGGFTHMVLLNDWMYWTTPYGWIDSMARSAKKAGKKPVFINLTYEMENQGREYLMKVKEAEHSNTKCL